MTHNKNKQNDNDNEPSVSDSLKQTKTIINNN